MKIHYKVARNVAQYPLHHETYAATKFEVATSNGLGGDPFARKLHVINFLVNASPPKPLNVATSNYASA